MEVKKTGKIEYKVFKERDLTKLMDFLIALEEEINHEKTELQFEVRFEDGTTNLGYDKSVLDDTKIIKLVICSLNNYPMNKKIRIDINYFSSEYSVAAEDKDWVNAKFIRIKEIIDGTPNQNIWFSNFRRQLFISNAFGLTLGFLLYITFFMKILTGTDKNSTGFAILMFLSLMLGQFISNLLLNKWLFKFYPEIAFDTTLDHLNKNKKRKSATLAIATFVFLPLILNFISSRIF